MKSIPYCPIARKRRHTITTPKSEWKKYRPDRYLYHLSYGGIMKVDEEKVFLKRLSIATEGICGIDKNLGGVWANNQIKRIKDLWPICFDSWDCHTSQEYLEMLYQFDVWQIDTSLVDNRWYLDPNIINDVDLVGSGDASDYLYCENTVHPRALKLFTFSINDYKFLYEDKRNVEFVLEPVEKINEFISYKWKKNK
jgi:hypothetical protein